MRPGGVLAMCRSWGASDWGKGVKRGTFLSNNQQIKSARTTMLKLWFFSVWYLVDGGYTWHLVVVEGKYKIGIFFNTDLIQLQRKDCLDVCLASLMFFVFHASSMWPLKPSSSHWWVQLLPTTGISKSCQLIRAIATSQRVSRELLGNGFWLPMAARCINTYTSAAASHQ